MAFRRLIIVLLVIIFSALAVNVATATIGLYGTGTPVFYCDEVRFQYQNYGVPAVQFRVVNASGTPVSAVVNGTGNSSFTTITASVEIPLNDAQPQGTQLRIQYNDSGPWYNLSPFGLAACNGLIGISSTRPAPLYNTMGGVGARLRMIVVNDPNTPDNPVLAFYSVSEDATAKLAFFIPKSDLDKLPDKPEETITIWESADGKYAFYKLTSGEYQINVGPDAEGKVQVVIFTGVPPTNVYGYTFIVGAQRTVPVFMAAGGIELF